MDQSVTNITESLEMLAEYLDIDLGSWGGKRELAFKLWNMAGAKAPSSPWSPEYLHGVIKGTTPPSQIMKKAIIALGADLDGIESDIAKAYEVSVFASGKLWPGTLVKGDSKRCKYPPCKINFIPRDSRNKYHAPKCQRADYKRIKTQLAYTGGKNGTSPTDRGGVDK